MLIAQGSADFQVYPDKDYSLWQTTLAGRDNVTFKLYDGLSHLFMPNQISAGGVPDASVYNPPNHVDAQVIADIAAWITRPVRETAKHNRTQKGLPQNLAFWDNPFSSSAYYACRL
jgi:hypothetical protein